MLTESPFWFFRLYATHGESFATWVADKPALKSVIRLWMNLMVTGRRVRVETQRYLRK
jgi:hypothetical protein